MYKYRDFGQIILRDESSDIGKGRLSASTFSDFFKNCTSMPKRKYCEHPTKHANPTRVPEEVVFVSTRLSMFLISRYDTADHQIHWLCPTCHAFE
ncbi:unnamed protein product [Rotaria socialis]|uniref:Uncharacterized protein n=1 Tax=Rotaria socialis TaxID=392032 RepID=A0A820L269_9BILA|nr:unnamed protein product [Rotaria socialis]CAF4349283.1 unnamed protein product [Rotaria socialis]CAF4617370.1 unnamed protein product [Rotaria socialis]CAF4946503.1 unnamed protein product [Rotaria socialis]